MLSCRGYLTRPLCSLQSKCVILSLPSLFPHCIPPHSQPPMVLFRSSYKPHEPGCHELSYVHKGPQPTLTNHSASNPMCLLKYLPYLVFMQHALIRKPHLTLVESTTLATQRYYVRHPSPSLWPNRQSDPI